MPGPVLDCPTLVFRRVRRGGGGRWEPFVGSGHGRLDARQPGSPPGSRTTTACDRLVRCPWRPDRADYVPCRQSVNLQWTKPWPATGPSIASKPSFRSRVGTAGPTPVDRGPTSGPDRARRQVVRRTNSWGDLWRRPHGASATRPGRHRSRPVARNQSRRRSLLRQGARAREGQSLRFAVALRLYGIWLDPNDRGSALDVVPRQRRRGQRYL